MKNSSEVTMELEQRRGYMEIVLKNVTAGIISIDKAGLLTTINTSAERLLDVRAPELLGKNFRDVLRAQHLGCRKRNDQ